MTLKSLLKQDFGAAITMCMSSLEMSAASTLISSKNILITDHFLSNQEIFVYELPWNYEFMNFVEGNLANSTVSTAVRRLGF
jgi:hypothetical protein